MKNKLESKIAGWLILLIEIAIIVLFAFLINKYQEDYFSAYIIFLIIGSPILKKINNLRFKLNIKLEDIKKEYKLSLKDQYFDLLINVGFGFVYIMILQMERPNSYMFEIVMIISVFSITLFDLIRLDKRNRNRLILTEKEVILIDGEIRRVKLNNDLVVDRYDEDVLRLKNGGKELTLDLNRILNSNQEELINEFADYKTIGIKRTK